MTLRPSTNLILLAVVAGTAGSAQAQTAPPIGSAMNPVRVEAELAAGGTWFLDDSATVSSLLGGSARVWLTPRLAVGPEYTYWVGPGDDRDQALSGNLTYAFRASGATPFVLAGGGLFRHSDRFGNTTFASTEGTFTLGGGVRIPFKGGWYLAPEARIGWEPHTRLHVAVGRRF